MPNNVPSSIREGKTDKPEVPSDLISFLKAKMILEGRFPDTSDEEIAMWIFLDPPDDYEPNRDVDPDYPHGFEDYSGERPVYRGLTSYYTSENDRAEAFKIYERAIAGEVIDWGAIRENVHLRFFSRRDIESFTPPDRWIYFSSLTLRWSEMIGEDDAAVLIDRKLDIQRMLDIDEPIISGELAMGYPVVNVGKTKEMCMYSMSQIQLIEKKEHLSEISKAKAKSDVAASASQTIDRNEVMSAFPVKADGDRNVEFWDEKLSDPPQWLMDARAQVGKRGVSSLWDPLLTAHCLFQRKYMSLRQLDSAIHKSFPELLDQWKDETEDLR